MNFPNNNYPPVSVGNELPSIIAQATGQFRTQRPVMQQPQMMPHAAGVGVSAHKKILEDRPFAGLYQFGWETRMSTISAARKMLFTFKPATTEFFCFIIELSPVYRVVTGPKFSTETIPKSVGLARDSLILVFEDNAVREYMFELTEFVCEEMEPLPILHGATVRVIDSLTSTYFIWYEDAESSGFLINTRSGGWKQLPFAQFPIQIFAHNSTVLLKTAEQRGYSVSVGGSRVESRITMLPKPHLSGVTILDRFYVELSDDVLKLWLLGSFELLGVFSLPFSVKNGHIRWIPNKKLLCITEEDTYILKFHSDFVTFLSEQLNNQQAPVLHL
ncbi:hypothetical protein PCE1_003321 [Barthelona sp. PCE]